MCKPKMLSVAVVVAVLVLGQVDGRPYRSLSRQKRISDQRLAELETLIALSKMKSKMVTIPVGFGKVDPNKLGRRKRSVNELLKVLLKELTSEEAREEVSFEEDDGDPYRDEDNPEDGRERIRNSGERHNLVLLPE